MFFNKKKEQDIKTEFDQDIIELMGSKGTQCLPDICKAEFDKALKLSNNMTENDLKRAFLIMKSLSEQFNYIPAIMWMGDFLENAVHNLPAAVEHYKKAADLGDPNGARNFADMVMTGQGANQDVGLAMKYYNQASEGGIGEASFVLAQFFIRNRDLDMALEKAELSVKQGYAPAKVLVDRITSAK